MAYREKSKFRSTVGGLGLFVGLGIVTSQIGVWFLLGIWNPISIATIFDLLIVAVENYRPMESLIGLQNIIDGTSFFGLPASAAFAAIGLVFVAPIRMTESVGSVGNDRRHAKALPTVS
jgi:hypothetical protein